MGSKISVLTLALMMGATSLFAEDNGKAIDYYKVGMYGEAKKEMLANLQSGKTDKAEVCYYLGELYSAQNMKDSAAYYYKEGIVADPDYVLNSIGELKLDLANNPNADKAFSGFLTGKNKKNPAVYIAIARAYLPVSTAKAMEYMEQARAVAPKSPDVFILEGDILAAKKQYGDAASRYEQAIYFDNKCKEAYFKYAKIYSRSNPQYAIDMLNKLIEMDPEYTVAYGELADVYYKNEEFAKAADAFSKYVNVETSDMKDLARYATLLYFSGDQDKALELVTKVSQREPNNTVLRRLNMYINYDKGDYAKSLELAKTLMGQVEDSSKLITRDYMYFARTLSKNDLHKEAAEVFEKAVNMDTARVELLKEMGSEYEAVKDYDKAIGAYKRYIDQAKDVKLNDYFNLGKVYYTAGASIRPTEDGVVMTESDSMRMVDYLKGADSLFAHVVEKAPESYLGYLFRGRANWAIDNPQAPKLAKPFYEQAIAVMEKDPQKNAAGLIEAYRFMGVHYIGLEDYPASLEYWKKILELNPDNAEAKRMAEVLPQYIQQ